MARHSGPITAVRCVWGIELSGPAIASRAPFVCRGGVIMIADLIFEYHPPP